MLLTAKARRGRSSLTELTPRELDVLALLAEGKSNAAIAESLVLTKRAIESNMNAIFLKLDLSQSQEIEDIGPRVNAALSFLSDTGQPAVAGRARIPVIGRRAPLSQRSRAAYSRRDSAHARGDDDVNAGQRSPLPAVRVLTVDDQAVFRTIAREVIDATPGFESAGEVASGEEALQAVERLEPQLVILDVRMPGMDGIEIARRLTASHPRTLVVLVSIEESVDIPSAAQLEHAVPLVRKQDFGPTLLRRLWITHGA